MEAFPALLIMLAAFPLAILLGLAIGALILRAACSIFNALAGGEHSPFGVPNPRFGWAMLIILVQGLIHAIVGVGVSFMLGVALFSAPQQVGPAQLQGAQLLANLVSIAVNFIVGSALLSAMLPTSFGRALLVTLIEFLIVLALAALVVVAMIVAGAGFIASLR